MEIIDVSSILSTDSLSTLIKILLRALIIITKINNSLMLSNTEIRLFSSVK